MLAGARVLDDTASAYMANAGAAVRATPDRGDAIRRSRRRRQARQAIGGALIYGEEEWSELDLRVDDHSDPLAELERLEAVSRERWVHFRQFLPSRKNPAGVTDRAIIDAGVEAAIAGEK